VVVWVALDAAGAETIASLGGAAAAVLPALRCFGSWRVALKGSDCTPLKSQLQDVISSHTSGFFDAL